MDLALLSISLTTGKLRHFGPNMPTCWQPSPGNRSAMGDSRRVPSGRERGAGLLATRSLPETAVEIQPVAGPEPDSRLYLRRPPLSSSSLTWLPVASRSASTGDLKLLASCTLMPPTSAPPTTTHTGWPSLVAAIADAGGASGAGGASSSVGGAGATPPSLTSELSVPSRSKPAPMQATTSDRLEPSSRLWSSKKRHSSGRAPDLSKKALTRPAELLFTARSMTSMPPARPRTQSLILSAARPFRAELTFKAATRWRGRAPPQPQPWGAGAELTAA
mmetsp:Transcript_69828/g.185588  ORF Transcript_69828/g.185588 Transcript_69828/m.185588 type:complete len:276 (+) Transcript_69828:799-1626(+)